MKALSVKNHNKFRKFDYINFPHKDVCLGYVIFKEYLNQEAGEEQEPEIGVVIQTHDDEEYRTDMFGNDSLGEGFYTKSTLATLEQIKKYRPELLKDLLK